MSETFTDVTVCRHHWLIAEPSGPTSHGTCKRCGAERDFKNHTDEFIWEDFTINKPRWAEPSYRMEGDHA